MDNKKGDKDEKPLHKVHVKSFYISRYEITNSQYAKFLNHYKSDTVKEGIYNGQIMIYEHEMGLVKNNGIWKSQSGFEKHLVVNITWYGANEFCSYLKCRLPTEAEWQYAAKGGKESKGFIFCGSDKSEEVAWYNKNSYEETLPIASKQPNELDIFDLSGNVWEWC